VLGYERKVVEALSTTTDATERTAVLEWVEGSLASMPEVLRAGVALGSVVLGVWATATGKHGRALVDALEASPFPPVRLHLRLLRSLVLFGDLELSPGARP
jgi:hypothetical protein